MNSSELDQIGLYMLAHQLWAAALKQQAQHKLASLVHTEQQEGNEADSWHRGPGQLGVQRRWQDGEPDEEEAGRVAGVRHGDGRAQETLAATEDILVGGDVVLHLHALDVADARCLDDV